MSSLRAEPLFANVVRSSDQVGPRTVLGVCASMKPAPGADGRSAVRSLLELALGRLSDVYPDVGMLDLRSTPPPYFEGHDPATHPDPNARLAVESIQRAGALILGIPAYWSGLSGVFKNFVDVVCGPTYDLPEHGTAFTGKPCGIVVVGADEPSAQEGEMQATRVLGSVGAVVLGAPIVIANPRIMSQQESAHIGAQLVAMAAELARGLV